MSVLVVDSPRFRAGERIVCVCDLDEFLVRGVIASGKSFGLRFSETDLGSKILGKTGDRGVGGDML